MSYAFASPHNPSPKSIGMGVWLSREITAIIMMVAATKIKVVTINVKITRVTIIGAKIVTWSTVLGKMPAEAKIQYRRT
jgi:hypothetical protein